MYKVRYYEVKGTTLALHVKRGIQPYHRGISGINLFTPAVNLAVKGIQLVPADCIGRRSD